MHSNEEIAAYLRSISQGVKVNEEQLLQRTNIYLSKYMNEYQPNTKFLDHEVFELALI